MKDSFKSLLFGLAVVALTVESPASAQAPTPAPAPATTPGEQKPPFKPEELDQMLAPIALYSDALLSQVLMAATYPLEVVEAARWVKANPNVKGDAAVKAVQDKTWDVSVKSLAAFPQVLVTMNDQLDWTQKLGDAVLAQQKDVGASIQRLRKLSYDAGNLKTSDQQKVNVQPSTPQAPQTIVIEPTSPESVYVPNYQPSWAYGSWPNSTYPPSYYPPPAGYGYGAPLLTGFMYGAGIAATGAMFGGWNWASGDMNVNVNRAVNIDRNFDGGRYQNGQWNHQTDHRKGVGYRDAGTQQRYGKSVAGADARKDFRGKDPGGPAGAGGQRPGGGQVGGGQRPGGGQVGGGQRPAGGQVGGGQRPGGSQSGGAVGGVDRGGQQVNREAARGRSSAGGQGGGGSRGGGGGGRGGGGGGGGGGRR